MGIQRHVMAEHPGSEAEEERDQAVTYIAELTSELALVARRHGLETLGYLLDMARLEAENTARPRTTDPKAKVARG
jgi:hypothetical protein